MRHCCCNCFRANSTGTHLATVLFLISHPQSHRQNFTGRVHDMHRVLSIEKRFLRLELHLRKRIVLFPFFFGSSVLVLTVCGESRRHHKQLTLPFRTSCQDVRCSPSLSANASRLKHRKHASAGDNRPSPRNLRGIFVMVQEWALHVRHSVLFTRDKSQFTLNQYSANI